MITAGVNARAGGYFGISVAADQATVLVGASGDPGRAGTTSGATYAFAA